MGHFEQIHRVDETNLHDHGHHHHHGHNGRIYLRIRNQVSRRNGNTKIFRSYWVFLCVFFSFNNTYRSTWENMNEFAIIRLKNILWNEEIVLGDNRSLHSLLILDQGRGLFPGLPNLSKESNCPTSGWDVEVKS